MSAISTAFTVAAFAAFAVFGVVLTIIDARTHRLPNRVVGLAALTAVVLLSAAALSGGRGAQWLGGMLGAATLFVAYLALRMLSGSGIGGGDVKLAAVVGFHLGWFGWSALLVGSAAAFLLGGAFAAILMLTRRADARTGIPFGPWMIAGAWIGIIMALSSP